MNIKHSLLALLILLASLCPTISQAQTPNYFVEWLQTEYNTDASFANFIQFDPEGYIHLFGSFQDSDGRTWTWHKNSPDGSVKFVQSFPGNNDYSSDNITGLVTVDDTTFYISGYAGQLDTPLGLSGTGEDIRMMKVGASGKVYWMEERDHRLLVGSNLWISGNDYAFGLVRSSKGDLFRVEHYKPQQGAGTSYMVKLDSDGDSTGGAALPSTAKNYWVHQLAMMNDTIVHLQPDRLSLFNTNPSLIVSASLASYTGFVASHLIVSDDYIYVGGSTAKMVSGKASSDVQVLVFDKSLKYIGQYTYEHPASGEQGDYLYDLRRDGDGTLYLGVGTGVTPGDQYRNSENIGLVSISPSGTVKLLFEQDGKAKGQDSPTNLYLTSKYIYMAATVEANTTTNENDVMAFRLKRDGTVLWSDLYDGPDKYDDLSGFIREDKAGNIYMTGRFAVGGNIVRGLLKWRLADTSFVVVKEKQETDSSAQALPFNKLAYGKLTNGSDVDHWYVDLPEDGTLDLRADRTAGTNDKYFTNEFFVGLYEAPIQQGYGFIDSLNMDSGYSFVYKNLKKGRYWLVMKNYSPYLEPAPGQWYNYYNLKASFTPAPYGNDSGTVTMRTDVAQEGHLGYWGRDDKDKIDSFELEVKAPLQLLLKFDQAMNEQVDMWVPTPAGGMKRLRTTKSAENYALGLIPKGKYWVRILLTDRDYFERFNEAYTDYRMAFYATDADAREPNDTPAQASYQPIVSRTSACVGKGLDKVDWYKVHTEYPGNLRVIFSDAAGLKVSLHNSAPYTAIESKTLLQNDDSLKASVQPGWYYLRVASQTDICHSIEFRFTPGDGWMKDEKPGNNGINTMGHIGANSTLAYSLGYSYDGKERDTADYFILDSTTGMGTFTVSLKAVDTTLGGLRFSLVDKLSGVQVASVPATTLLIWSGNPRSVLLRATGSGYGAYHFTAKYEKTSGIEQSNQEPIVLWPSPTADFIGWRNIPADVSQIEILNAAGQVVETIRKVKASGGTDVSKLSPGVYYLRAQDSRVLGKFVRQ